MSFVSYLFALVVQVTIWWCCVGGTSPWRLPHVLPPPPTNLQKTAAFQLSRDFYRERLARNDTTRWHTSPPAPVSASVITKPSLSSSSSSSSSFNQGNGSSNSYKNFYRVFYGPHLEGLQNKRLPEYVSSTSRPHHLNGRIIYGTGDNTHITPELEDVRQANEHFLKIRNMAKCNLPNPKVIRVKDYYPEPTKEYLPKCTILHRCGDYSSCCENEAFECVATAIQEVVLHFYSLQVPKYGVSVSATNMVEKLLFENHTLCECQPINDLPRAKNPSDLSETRGSEVEALTTTLATTSASTSVPSSSSTTATSVGQSLMRETLPNHLHPSKCRECPVPFNRRDFPDGRCSCDCFDKHKPCLKIKRGRDPLNEVERRCVEVAHCHIPECEYGSYDYDSGRCPKKPDNYRKVPDSKEYQNHHHRWNFFERD